MKQVFEYADYRKYLLDQLGEKGTRTGGRQRACDHLGCHSTYLSQVFSEKIEISLEHADALTEFFSHSKEEKEYFLLLVLRARAGTKSLKEHFDAQIKVILQERNLIKKRVPDGSELSVADRDRFYSSWLYGALHVLVSIKDFQTLESLSRATGVNSQTLVNELEFMIKTGLILNSQGKYKIGPKMVHLGADSGAISKHHTNWRFHAIQSLARRRPSDLHYSAVATMTEEVAQEVRESILLTLEKNLKQIEQAKEEATYVYNFDFYRFV